MIAFFRQLILSITAASLFGAVMLTVTEQKSQRSVLQLAIGLLLLLAIINPLRRFQLPDVLSWVSGIETNLPQEQEKAYRDAVEETFRKQTEQYLEGRLRELGVNGVATLTLSEDGELQVAEVSVLCDAYTAEQKHSIEQLMQNELGVRKEVISIRSEGS